MRSQILLLCMYVRFVDYRCSPGRLKSRQWNCTTHDAGTFLHSNDSVLKSSSTAREICSTSSHLRRGKEKNQTEQQMHSSIMRNTLFKGDALSRDGWSDCCHDATTILLFKCIFQTVVSLWYFLLLPLCGNTELGVNYWVNCGVPIGTLVVVGMTGVGHCRRRWEVRCMKEWEARKLQLRDQRRTRVTRKCLLQANVPRTEMWHAY